MQQPFDFEREYALARRTGMRGGKLYDARFGSPMRGEGIFADQISRMFRVAQSTGGALPG